MAEKTFTFKELHKRAAKVTQAAVLKSGRGRMLCTECGARLLGLFPRADGPNVLWVCGRFDDHMQVGNWVIGGERMWLAPEPNFRTIIPEKWLGGHVPSLMDPGKYRQVGDCAYENRFPLFDFSRRLALDNTVARREFSPIEDPYHTGRDFAGARIRDSISVEHPDIEIAPWTITQVYTRGKKGPGTVVIPIACKAPIITYFRKTPPGRCATTTTHIRFKLDSADVCKIGIIPEQVDRANPCRILYISPSADAGQWFCIIKRSDDLPRTQEESADISNADIRSPRGAVQSYNNSLSSPFHFGELEITMTKAVAANGKTQCTRMHELLAYMGTKAQMLEVARTALKLDKPPVLF